VIDYAEKPRLHYVETVGISRGEGQTRRTAQVQVSDASAPLVLFLRAYHPVEWSVTLAPGVRVRHLVMFGQYKQTAIADGSIPSIRSYSPEEGNHDKVWRALHNGQNSRLDLADEIERLLGLTVATMQFRCREEVCVIDGVRSWRFQSVSTRTGRPVVWVIGGKPAPGGKRVAHPGRGMGDTVRASEARNSGKWYFELKAEPMDSGKKTWAGGTVGVVDASSSSQWSDLLYHTSVTAGSARRLEPGSTISVALDLDSGHVYYGIDGKWTVGDPAAGTGGRPLKRKRDYYPAVRFDSVGNTASDGRPDQVDPGAWTGRFAASEFEYSVPPGYVAYESAP
jgi:hypothetical protein